MVVPWAVFFPWIISHQNKMPQNSSPFSFSLMARPWGFSEPAIHLLPLQLPLISETQLSGYIFWNLGSFISPPNSKEFYGCLLSPEVQTSEPRFKSIYSVFSNLSSSLSQWQIFSQLNSSQPHANTEFPLPSSFHSLYLELPFSCSLCVTPTHASRPF